MEIETLKGIIEQQRKEIEEKFKDEKIIERKNLNYVKSFLRYPNVVAILGVRRSGKSIFSLLLSTKIEEAGVNPCEQTGR